MNLFLSFGQMNCTSLLPLTLTWTSEQLALRAGSIVQPPKLILRLIFGTMWGGSTTATFLDVQQQIAQSPTKQWHPTNHSVGHKSRYFSRTSARQSSLAKCTETQTISSSKQPLSCHRHHHHHPVSALPGFQEAADALTADVRWPSYEVSNRQPWTCADVLNGDAVRVTWLVPGVDGQYFLPLWSLFLGVWSFA